MGCPVGRIRTVKPEILEDDVTAALSDGAWRLFVSLFLLADDYGNLRANPRQIAGQAFWARPDADIVAMLDELATAGLVAIYSVRGQRYAAIKGWSKHQKVDKPGKPHCPPPEEADASPPEFHDSRQSRDGLATVSVLTPTPTCTSTPTSTPTTTDGACEKISLPDATQTASSIQLQWSVTQRNDFSKLRPTVDEWAWALERALAAGASSVGFLLSAIAKERKRGSALPEDVKGPSPPRRLLNPKDQAIADSYRAVEAFNAKRDPSDS